MQKYPFNNFYTSNEPVQFHKENRFEGKSSYLAYYPTGQTFEQEMEQFWFDAKNKELADKRRDEEQRETMKEWGNARGRMESEIARKKEHLNVATNFELARGWTRSNWKTKNFDHNKRDQEEFLQLSEDSEQEDNEARVMDGEESNPSPAPKGPRDSLNISKKQMSVPNLLGLSQKGPSVVDLTEDEEYGFRPSTAAQAMQLEAITEYNAKLPPKKKLKGTLPEIVASNVYAKTIREKEEKKGKISYNMTKKFYNIGFVDGS